MRSDLTLCEIGVRFSYRYPPSFLVYSTICCGYLDFKCGYIVLGETGQSKRESMEMPPLNRLFKEAKQKQSRDRNTRLGR